MQLTRAGDPHSFFADPEPVLNLCKKLPYEEFSEVEKDYKDCSKVKNHGAGPNLLQKFK